MEEAIEEHMLDPEQILAEGAEIDTATLIDQFAEKAEQTQAKALAYYKYMGALAFQNHTEKALTAYTHAVTLDPDDAESWNELGSIQKRLGKLRAAKQSYEKVLALGNQLADKTLIAVATGNLGLICRTQGDLPRAEEHHRRALALNEELDRKEGMASELGNLGLIYRSQGDLPRAEEHHRRALSMEEELGRKEGMAAQLGNLGLIYQTQGDLPRACQHWQQALTLFKEVGMRPQIEQTQKLLDEAGCSEQGA